MRCEVADVTGIVKYIGSVKVFFGSKRGGLCPSQFFVKGASDTAAPLLLRLCLSQTEVKYMNPFPRDKEFEI